MLRILLRIKAVGLSAFMSGRSQVWKPNSEDFPRSESLFICLYSLLKISCLHSTVISNSLKSEGLLGFPTEANRKEALKQEETQATE